MFTSDYEMYDTMQLIEKMETTEKKTGTGLTSTCVHIIIIEALLYISISEYRNYHYILFYYGFPLSLSIPCSYHYI